jgi:hypothetical protein
MTENEEMPVEVLLDAWYLKYENNGVYFPLLRNPSRIAHVFMECPLKTAMWKNRYHTLRLDGDITDMSRNHFVEFYGKNKEWALHTYVVSQSIARVQLRYKGN